MQVQSIIDRHRGVFAAAGAELSLQRAQRSWWIQIDVTQAMGMPGRGSTAIGDDMDRASCHVENSTMQVDTDYKATGLAIVPILFYNLVIGARNLIKLECHAVHSTCRVKLDCHVVHR